MDLRERCEYFYGFGLRLNSLVAGTGLGTFLLTTFQQRYRALLARAPAASSSDAEGGKVWRRLTHEERVLFAQGEAAVALFISWRSVTHAQRMAKARAPAALPRKRAFRDVTNNGDNRSRR